MDGMQLRKLYARLIYFTRCNHRFRCSSQRCVVIHFGVCACRLCFSFRRWLPTSALFAAHICFTGWSVSATKNEVNGKPDSITWHFSLQVSFVFESDLWKGFNARKMPLYVLAIALLAHFSARFFCIIYAGCSIVLFFLSLSQRRLSPHVIWNECVVPIVEIVSIVVFITQNINYNCIYPSSEIPISLVDCVSNEGKKCAHSVAAMFFFHSFFVASIPHVRWWP